MYRVNEFLTPEERLGMIQVGAMRELAANGIGPGEFADMVKSAGNNDEKGASLVSTLKDMLTIGLVSGIPLGSLAFAVDSSLKTGKRRNKKLKSELDQYNDIVYDYRRQLGLHGNGER